MEDVRGKLYVWHMISLEAKDIRSPITQLSNITLILEQVLKHENCTC